jgi:D-glycero-D-manno-heptose 1,7-bisphosphate phosphatase
MNPAVFLDRDGTMIHDVGYLARRQDVTWYPFTIDAIRLLNRAGFLVYVVTNQGGIGLGHTTDAFVRGLHEDMDRTIVEAGGAVAGWYYCPHHPQAVVPGLQVACECRKPRPGLVRRAAAERPIALDRSFVVGDKGSDMGLASSAGLRGVLVRTGYGAGQIDAGDRDAGRAAHVADDLMAAAAWILAEAGAGREAGA